MSAARRDSLIAPRQAEAIQLVSGATALTASTAHLTIAASQDSGKDSEALLTSLTKKQAEAVRLTGQFARAYAAGAAARVSVLDNLSFGLTFASAASPFISKKFDDSYQQTTHYLTTGSTLLGLVASLTVSRNTPTRFAILGGGVGLASIIDLLRQSDAHVAKQAATGFETINATIDLFDFNRLVFNDMLRLKGMVEVARRSDSTLTDATKAFVENSGNQALLRVDSDSMARTGGFCEYITSAESLFVRLQPLIQQVDNIYQTAEAMVTAYQANPMYNPKAAATNPFATDVRLAIDQLAHGVKSSQDSWATLHALLVISPADTRQLSAFYELQELKETIGAKRRQEVKCVQAKKVS